LWFGNRKEVIATFKKQADCNYTYDIVLIFNEIEYGTTVFGSFKGNPDFKALKFQRG
jgi:hypothetical protein